MSKHEFPIHEVYERDATNLLEARAKSKLVHKTGDIDASGDEFEKPVREFLKGRLPAQYLVGHGHIVDRRLNISPQLDVIIADSSAVPILFEGQNGTQYFPYESVYAVGEVRSTYYDKKTPILNFGNTLAKIKAELFREPTPPTYIGNGLELAAKTFTATCHGDHRNPLFGFMVFGDQNNFDESQAALQLLQVADVNLPNVCCFLNGSVLLKTKINRTESGANIEAIDMHPLRTATDHEWVKLTMTSKGASGQALAVMMLGLFDHLTSCLLMRPPLQEYLTHILERMEYSAAHLSYERWHAILKNSGDPLPPDVDKILKILADGKKR